MDKRFEQVDKRFDDINKRFSQIQWTMGLGFTILAVLMGIFISRSKIKFTQSP